MLVLTGGTAIVAAGPVVSAGTVFEASDSGPTVIITEQLELADDVHYPDGQTVGPTPSDRGTATPATGAGATPTQAGSEPGDLDNPADEDVTAETPGGPDFPIVAVSILGVIALLVAVGLWARHTSAGDDEQDSAQQDSPEETGPQSNQHEGAQDLDDDRGQQDGSNE